MFTQVITNYYNFVSIYIIIIDFEFNLKISLRVLIEQR